MKRYLCAPIVVLLAAACVPADDALGLGSVQFTFTSSAKTKVGMFPGSANDQVRDRYRVRFDRVVLGFRTMTVGKIGAPDTCSYRGRGAASDAVFRPLGAAPGLVQTFNGIQPVSCPDVGVIFGPPQNTTLLDANATPDDLVELAQGGLHAIVDATATSIDTEVETKILLRFNPLTTSTRFGGCRQPQLGAQDGLRGTRILSGKRDEVTVFFAAENLFREAISDDVPFRIRPFIQADDRGNGDGIVTMDELDILPLSAIPAGDFYQIPASSTANNVTGSYPSLGDFVRFLFRFTLLYRSEAGTCTGNEPGSDEP